MSKKEVISILSLCKLGILMLGFLILPVMALAQPSGGGAPPVGAPTIPNPLNSNTFGDLLTKIATGVGTLIATLGTIMLIIAGILYLISAGSPERITRAKKALVYAIAGIAIGVAANAIVAILKNVLGA